LEFLAGLSRLPAAKWLVPGGVKAAGDGDSFSVEWTLDLIAFQHFLSGSFALNIRTML
jgi:hypothetical protein